MVETHLQTPMPTRGRTGVHWRGERWGDYLLSRPLGYGRTNEVFEAIPLTGGAPVAVKLRRKELLAPAGSQGRFEREASVLRLLDHPHLLRVRACGTANGRDGLVVDLASRGPLPRFLAEEGPLNFGVLDSLGTGLILALSATHGAGLLHGQIRAAKVLVTGHPEVPVAKLTGFGQARDANFDVDDPRGDIYDLGAVLYRLAMAGHRDVMQPLELRALDGHPWLPLRLTNAITAALAPTWRRPRSPRTLLAIWQGTVTWGE